MHVPDDGVGNLAGKDGLKQRAAGCPMVVETQPGVGGCVWSEEVFQAAVTRKSK